MKKSIFSIAIPKTGEEELKAKYPRVNFYSGSTSHSLLYSKELDFSGDNRILIPTQELVRRGFPVYGGELGNTFDEKSINKNAVSGCDPRRAKNAYEWATKVLPEKSQWTRAKAGRSLLIAQDKEANVYLEKHQKADGIDETELGKLKKEIETLKSINMFLKDSLENLNIRYQIHNYDYSPQTKKDLIDNPFPVVYAFKIPLDKSKGGVSDIPGEITAAGGCTYEELEAIFVPSDKIDFVKTLLPEKMHQKIASMDFLNKIWNPPPKAMELTDSESDSEESDSGDNYSPRRSPS